MSKRPKRNEMKKKLAKIVGLSIAATAAGMFTYEAIQDHSYKKKVERLYEYHSEVENPIQLVYNKKDRSLSYGYNSTYYFGNFDDGQNEFYVTMWDYKENGLGDIDAIAAFDDEKYHWVGEPSKKLKRYARKFFRNGVDAAIEKIESGNNVFEGSDYKLLNKMIIEEYKSSKK